MKKKFSSLLLDADAMPSDEVKFSLYVKTREVKQIADTLRQLMLLPDAQKQAWAKEHETLLSELLDSFVEDSMMVMDGMNLDQEAMLLSMDLVSQLREVMNTLQSILSDKHRLNS